MTTEIKESTKEYLKLFNACPIKIGDTVRVIRGWKNGDYGYACPFNIENGNELISIYMFGGSVRFNSLRNVHCGHAILFAFLFAL